MPTLVKEGKRVWSWWTKRNSGRRSILRKLCNDCDGRPSSVRSRNMCCE